MARRGLIVALSGMSMCEDGDVSIANYGSVPKKRPIAGAAYIVPMATRRAMAQNLERLAIKAADGRITGVAAAVMFRDGVVERVCVGTLSGVGPVIAAICGGAYPFETA